MAEGFGRNWTESVPRSDAYISNVVVRVLRRVSPETILDIGCGNGALARRLTDEGYQVSGVDWDPKAVRLAAERVPEGRFSVRRFNEDPPALDFDAVVSTEVIEHLFDPNELLQFAFRALRPGGAFIITTPHHGYLKNLAISLVGGWDKHFMADVLVGHIKFFSRKTMTRALERNGFAIESFTGVGRVAFLWKSMVIVTKKPQAAVSPCH